MRDVLADAARRATTGDVSAVDGLREAWLGGPPADLELKLTSQAVRHVLRQLARGAISPEQAQRWASFVKRGFVPGLPGPISPIEIDFDSAAEEWIVHVLARLDEIGDVIDGDLSDAELRTMLVAAPPD